MTEPAAPGRAPGLSVEEIRRLLGLQPLEPEGGFFAETYRSPRRIFKGGAGSDGLGYAPLATAIYYLLTPDQISALHRLPTDEIYHFYLGDPVELLLLPPDGDGGVTRLGADLAAGERPQVVVPAGVWQGARLAAGGRFALVGTTVSPGFEFADYEDADTDELARAHPAWGDLIRALVRC
jgi:predicted cupin superfamily sugar epimerase